MNHPKQDQHKIPQVYLKKFGYVDANKQWKVTVSMRGETFTRQKSIKSFTAVTNVFDIESYDPNIRRIFEKLNCDLETGYHDIINDLDITGQLTNKSYAFLLQLVANLIIRSDYWRDLTLSLLNSPGKARFLQFITGHHCKDEAEYRAIDQQPFYKVLNESSPDDVLNLAMLYFMDHLMLRLWNYEIVIIRSQDDKNWWTSTNPIVAHHRENPEQRMEIFAKESEFYFPISPTYLAYLHFKGSADQANPLRALMTNHIYEADDAQNDALQQLILENPSDCVIIAGGFTYRVEQ